MIYKFGDIANNVTEKRSPKPEDSQNYIGLEHLDSGSLYVNRYGIDVELKGDKLVMHKGDVLLGKRNAYLRRAAIAPHDGLFSAHGMILRPKDVIASEFFPFFIASDKFFDDVIRISVGGLSPTVNWKDLKELEFDLPSLAEQKVLAEKLWAAYEVKQSYLKMIAATEEMVKAQFVEMFGDPIKNSHKWDIASLSALGELKNGMNFSTNENGCKIKCLGVSDFKERNKINSTEISSILSLNSFPSEDYLLKDDDIIFVRSNGNKNLVGRCMIIISSIEPLTFSGFCIRLRLNSLKVMSEFLLFLFKHPSIRQQIAGRGANINNLNQKVLSALPIIVPPMEFQEQFVAFFHQADKSVIELRKSVDAIDKVIKSFINENL